MTTLFYDIEKVIHSTYSTTLGTFRKKNQPWITYEILDLCDKRSVLNSSKKSRF